MKKSKSQPDTPKKSQDKTRKNPLSTRSVTEKKVYNVPAHFQKRAHINLGQYKKLYQQSIEDPETFWDEQAKKFIHWFTPFEKVKTGSFDKLDMHWFIGGKLNACYNCIDQHLETKKNQIAIIFEPDDPEQPSQKITYGELFDQVCRFANVLKKQGIQKEDTVCIYLPMIPEIIVAVLACTRIGAIHTVVFGGFSADSLTARILDAKCHLLITSDVSVRGGKIIPLKKNADVALQNCPTVKKVIVVKRDSEKSNYVESITWHQNRDLWYHELMQEASSVCHPEIMDSAEPLFILYTSGSTGKPKGVVHAIGGYLVYVALTYQTIFNYHEGDIYWCTADIGWITGHSYVLYGPLLNGATTLLFEGVPHYPSFSRYWEIIDKHQVNTFYTSPTALRSLRGENDDYVTKTSRKSLKLLGTVGEPINPEVWEWYHHVVGNGRCPIVDTWWQTETGGILISPLPGATALKPGSATLPFFGIVPEILDDNGKPVSNNKPGKLVIKEPWPGLMQTIYGDQKRFIETYFEEFPGYYLTGDGVHRDEDGYYWLSGRIDDVIKVSGHRLGTEELESALVKHPDVSEAAVVSVPHELKGEGIYAFVTIRSGVEANSDLKKALIAHVRNTIGPIATLDVIQWADALPKTRSGKIMRRILRKIARGEIDDLGDISTLADPNVLEDLIAKKRNEY